MATSLIMSSGGVSSVLCTEDDQPWDQGFQFPQEDRSDLLFPEDRRMNRHDS